MTSIVFDFDDIGERYRALGARWLGEPEQAAQAVTTFQCTRSYGGFTCPGICVKQRDAGQPSQCADFGWKPISFDPYNNP